MRHFVTVRSFSGSYEWFEFAVDDLGKVKIIKGILAEFCLHIWLGSLRRNVIEINLYRDRVYSVIHMLRQIFGKSVLELNHRLEEEHAGLNFSFHRRVEVVVVNVYQGRTVDVLCDHLRQKVRQN